MTAKEVIRDAAKYIREFGWTQGELGEDNGPKCLVGALLHVSKLESPMTPPWARENYQRAISMLNAYRRQGSDDGTIVNLVVWNDAHATKEEVLALLDEVGAE